MTRDRRRLPAIALALLLLLSILMLQAAQPAQAAEQYSIQVSSSSARSASTLLANTTVAGTKYIFVTPGTGASSVRFWLDDPQMTGPPRKTENRAPHDFAGTAKSGAALPFDTATLTDGSHTVTAAVSLTAGGTVVLQATFAVGNAKFVLSPAVADLQAAEGGAAATQTAAVTVSGGGTASFSLDESAPWLTLNTIAGTAPASFTLTADPSNLPTGLLTTSVTVTSTGGTGGPLGAILLVNFQVGNRACLPLPCEQIRVELPFERDFSEDEGGVLDANGVGTGFTYVDQPSKGSGYLPANLTMDTLAGVLKVRTTAGLASRTSNSQDNALGIGIRSPSQAVTMSTTLTNIPGGSGKFEQAGLWFGINEDNYIKLTVQSVVGGMRFEHNLEVAGTSTNKSSSTTLAVSGQSAELSLKADPLTLKATASYSLAGAAPTALGTFTVPSSFFGADAAGIDPRIGTRTFAGILASHRNGSSPVTFEFGRFSVVTGASTTVGSQTANWFDRKSYTLSFPTSMVWGPDGRLYVTELFGKIHALTFDAAKQVIDDEVITTLGSRMTIGATVDPSSTGSNVVLWVSHSSPSTNNGEVNSGMVSRLSGPGFTDRQDVITGLPRAKANHGPGSLHFGSDGRLYIAIGGNTGAGAPNSAGSEFGDRPEQPLSAALLVADVKAAGFQGSCATPLYEFGVPVTCNVRPFATGLRNIYDFVMHSNGRIYGPDNGLGVIGTYPPRSSPDCTGLASTLTNNPGEQRDPLHLLEDGAYYGHPNPYRQECVFFDGSKQGVSPLPNFRPAMYSLGSKKSANGIIEYQGEAFCGSLRNELLIANYSNGDDISRVRLSADGRSVVSASSLIGGFNDPLPLAQSPDGTIFVGEFGGRAITALVPKDVGCWRDHAPAPVELLDAGGAALNGKIYVVGGKTATGPKTTVYVYDPTADSWSTVADLPGPAVENPAVVAYGGRLYVFGGSTDPFSGAAANAASFDPSTGTWTPLPSMPTARGGPAAQVLGDRIYVVGGMGANGASVASAEVFDPLASSWSVGPNMSVRRDNPGAASIGGKLYVFGGRTRNADGSTAGATLNTVEALDPGTGTWTARSAMPTGRRTMVVAMIGGRALVMGGEVASDGSAFYQNEEYNPVTDTWRTLYPMKTGRHGAAAGVVDGVVYVIGGGATGGRFFSSLNQAFRFAPSN